MLQQNSLKGWNTIENPANFDVKDGILTCKGEKGLIVYQGEDAQPYRNFVVKARIKTSEGARASLLFHAPEKDANIPASAYAVAINNTYRGMEGFPNINMTGSLRRIRNMYYPYAENGAWFTLKVEVKANRIRIFVDGMKLVEYIEPEKPWRPNDLQNRKLGEGFIGLHSKSGASEVKLKNMQIKTLNDTVRIAPKVSHKWDEQITRLHAAHYPIVDLHTHLKDGLTMEQALQRSYKYGVNYGIAANCGLKFPITNDKQLLEYIRSLEDYPVFTAMQAEGREWVDLFSPDTIAMADYVFTDAMTWTNNEGQRMRLWIPEETYVDDPQNFMKQLTNEIVGVANEPIDIYVNPTFLPQKIRPQYNKLWTKSRIAKIVNALAKNNVALEINNRYQLPSKKILAKAKEAGVKFTIGTNNVTKNIGKPEYAVRMIKALNLKPRDFWLPHLKQ